MAKALQNPAKLKSTTQEVGGVVGLKSATVEVHQFMRINMQFQPCLNLLLIYSALVITVLKCYVQLSTKIS